MRFDERLTVEKLIEELKKYEKNSLVICESPYRDQFFLHELVESDDKSVIYLYG